MGGIGWHNAAPFQVGGGTTAAEDVYRAMRAAVGIGGSAKDDRGIEGLWRQARAAHIAAVGTFAERAALQAFPMLATAHLPVYERLLRITPLTGQTEEARRRAVSAAWTSQIDPTGPGIRKQLAAIDPRLSRGLTVQTQTTVTLHGRTLAPRVADPDQPPYGPLSGTAFPNYCSGYRYPAVFAVGYEPPVPNAADMAMVGSVRRMLGAVLPAWLTSQVATGVGFQLDHSPLDWTALTGSP